MKAKTKTKQVKRPMWGRFVPSSQVAPLLFRFCFHLRFCFHWACFFSKLDLLLKAAMIASVEAKRMFKEEQQQLLLLVLQQKSVSCCCSSNSAAAIMDFPISYFLRQAAENCREI